MFFTRSISEDDLRDLHGKVAIVTGSNTGIGYTTIQFLARKGAKVYMAARDEERAREAIEQLKKEDIGDGSVHWLELDLSEPVKAKRAAEKFLEMEKRLDILVNNAARGAYGTYVLDERGLLDIMVVNHFSPFTFTEALLPLLKSTAGEPDSDVRIVNVSSMAHARAAPKSFKGKETLNQNFGDSVLNHLDTYGYTKLANVLHAKHLQQRLTEANVPITCISLHPGSVTTSGSYGFIHSLPSFLHGLAKWTFVTPRRGAMNSAFAAAAKEVYADREKYKGAYLDPVGKISKSTKYAQDERLAVELYETTVDVLREVGIEF